MDGDVFVIPEEWKNALILATGFILLFLFWPKLCKKRIYSLEPPQHVYPPSHLGPPKGPPTKPPTEPPTHLKPPVQGPPTKGPPSAPEDVKWNYQPVT